MARRRPIELTRTEFRLLRYLLANARGVSRSQILDHVWDYDFGAIGVLETYISYLRRKVDFTDPADPHRARVGYVLRPPRRVR